MKAAQISTYGGHEVIEIVDIEKPNSQRGQVLVKVYASSINPFDMMVVKGVVANMTDSKLPMIIGSDISGVVAEIGEGVENFSVGNKIYGQGSVLTGATGAFSEFVAVPIGMIDQMPKNIDFNQSAAAVLTGVSAVQGLVDHINLRYGQKILIHGGAGGIGSIAIQIAKHMGAYVATTATGKGIDFVKKLGTDIVIDYKSHTNILENVGVMYDAVFDMVGGEVFEKSFKVLKRGGIMVSMVAQDKKNIAEKYGVAVISQSTKVNTERLNMLTQFIEKGAVRVYIDKIFSLDRIKEAFEEKAKGRVLGKIVIQIR